jgi:hypothetical protein
MSSKLTYTEMMSHLEQTWREQPRTVRAIAARYYIGAESMESLRAMATERPCTSRFNLPPVLTERQVEFIITMR